MQVLAGKNKLQYQLGVSIPIKSPMTKIMVIVECCEFFIRVTIITILTMMVYFAVHGF